MIIQRNGCPPPAPRAVPHGQVKRICNRINNFGLGLLLPGWNAGQMVALLLVLLLSLPPVPAEGKTRKGEKLRAEARAEEMKGNIDGALELAEQAFAQDAGDPSYNLLVRRIRFEAAAIHVKNGQKLRSAGKLDQALAEFEKAFGIDPASDIAAQEVRRTRDMIQRNATGGDGLSAAVSPDERKVLTPSELAKRETQDRTDSLLPVAELRPLNTDPIDLKMTNKPRVLFETVGKVAGVNVLFDPEYNQQQTIPQVQIDLNRTTLEESLDQIAVITKSFWKPLSKNAIFVTVDNPTKRREYAEQVVKVFYLSNVTSPQEMQELLTVLRTVVDVQKVFNYTSQNALVVRAESDTMALVEKLIADLDKPRGEVIIDVMVMEVSSTYMRNLTAAFAPTGITTSAMYGKTTSTSATSTSGTTPVAGTTTTNPLTLNRLGRISSQDYSLTNLPGAQFEAVLNDAATRVLQSPQIRAADKAKASIKIGDKVPTATGSFQPGVGSVGVSPLVNTQFTFLDVGVLIEITPYLHDNNEVSMHMDLDVSQVKSRIDLGGISQPIIGQNKAIADIRLKDGEVNLIGGIIQQTDSKATTGIPGLASIPILGRLFSGENIQKDRTELVIAIVPHIVRGSDVTRSNLQGVAVGNATQIKVGYAPRKPAPVPVTAGAGPLAGAPPATAPPMNGPPATAPLGVPPATAPAENEPLPTPPPPSGPPAPRLPGPGGPGPSLPGFARLSFLPGNSVDTQLSQSITVTIYAENVKDLTEAVARLQFDPKILRVNNIVAGDLPQRGGVTVQPSKNILNDAGQAEVSFSRETGVSGSGGLFSIILQAVGRGNTMLTLSGVSMRGMNGQSIPSNVPPALVVNVK
jgi:general secretion pathway protein D